MTQEELKNAGFEKIDGEARIKGLLSRASKVNFFEFTRPDSYDRYYATEDLEEREQIKKETEPLSDEEFALVVADEFMDKLSDYGFHSASEGARLLFYDPLLKTYFQLSNEKMILCVSLFAEKLGVPEHITHLPRFGKFIMQLLRHRIKLEELRRGMREEL